MTKVYFSGLDITLPNASFTLRDDGIVSDMKEHYEYVLDDFRKRGAIEIGPLGDIDENTHGKYVHGLFPNASESVIFQYDLGCEMKNHLVKAHEEAHILHDKGLLSILNRELKREGFYIVGLMTHVDPWFGDPEFVANLGGLLALDKKYSKTVQVDRDHHLYKAVRRFTRIRNSPIRPITKAVFSNYYKLKGI